MSNDFWVRGTGDTEYVISHQNELYRKKLLGQIKQSVNALIGLSLDSPVLTENSEGVNEFCFQLEASIVHGLQGDKRSANYARHLISFWDYIQLVCRHVPMMEKIRKDVERLPDVHTHDGKGRAFLRAILSAGKTEEMFRALVRERAKDKWYIRSAFLMSEEESSMLMSLLTALDTLHFRLTLNEPNLDVRLQHDQPGTQGRFPQAMVTDTGSGKTRKKRRKKKPTNIVEIGDAVSHSPATTDPERPAPTAASLLSTSQQDHADYKSMLAQVLQEDPSASPPPISSANREQIRAEKEKRVREQRKREKEEAKRREKEEKHRQEALRLQQEQEIQRAWEAEEKRAQAERERVEEENRRAEEDRLKRRQEEEEFQRFHELKQRQKQEQERRLQEQEKENLRLQRIRDQEEAQEQADQAQKEQQQAQKRRAEEAEKQRRQLQVKKEEEKKRQAAQEQAHVTPPEPEEPVVEISEAEEEEESEGEYGSDYDLSDNDDDALNESQMDQLLAQASALLQSSTPESPTPQPLETPTLPESSQEEEPSASENTPSASLDLEDPSLAEVMRSLEDTSFVDDMDLEVIMQDSPFVRRLESVRSSALGGEAIEGTIRVPGDISDYFLLAVAADKTPLATPAPVEQTVHIVSPVFSRERSPPEYEEPRMSGHIVQTEKRGTVLDLAPDTTTLVDEDLWLVIKRQIPLKYIPKGTLRDQGNICPACETPLNQGYVFSNVRFCSFYRLYFCSDCHQNQSFVVPAYVFKKWDFTLKKVSRPAAKILEALYDQPIYNIGEINPFLFENVPPMKAAKILRQQLFYVKDYILTCNRDKVNIMRTVHEKHRHLIYDASLYSIRDLVEIFRGDLLRIMKSIAERCVAHIKNCPLCSAKGFVCPFCRSPEYIFPFQLRTVIQCKGCDNFCHRRCYSPKNCPTCSARLMNHAKVFSHEQ